MKSLAIVFRQAPHGQSAGREALDLALLAASYEQQVHLLFVDEGVLHLLPQQQPEQIGCKDYIATFKALDLYDVASVAVCQESLSRYGLTQTPLVYAADKLSPSQIGSRLQQVDEVMVF